MAVAGAALVLALAGCTADDQSVPSTLVDPDVTSSSSTTTFRSSPTTTQPLPPEGGTSTSTTIPLSEVRLNLVEIDRGFEHPVLLLAAPDGGDDLVVEQPGRVVRADGADHEVVLDINRDVAFGGERGLLGMAVHPRFSATGLVYVNYVDSSGDTVVDEFVMRAGVVLPDSRMEIIRISQPAGNHNGGMLTFGPDGNLWIGMGDGGGSNDQYGHGQDADSLLGSMLRIAVGAGGGAPYRIPPDNPFADGEGGGREVWAIGLRNPWRFTIDGDALWIADVGQGSIEEVNVTPASVPGLNFGWPVLEGSQCFRSADCDATGMVVPIDEYTHEEGCSVTGGVVYRGSAVASLAGQFFYSDFCSGFLRSVSADGDTHDWSEQVGRISKPTGFGTGADGEMYIVTQGGSLLKLEAEK